MKYVFQLLIFFFIYITIPSYAADFIQNPDFEIPPTNSSSSSTNATAGINSIPGWSINGTVWYVASPWGGHALQLGPNGKINQTITATSTDDDGSLDYILSFNVGAQNQDCTANNLTALNIFLHDNWDSNESRHIYLQKNTTTNLWERHALFLGRLGGGDYIHLQIESVTTDVKCWPLLGAFTVNTNQLPSWYNGNLLSNEGFEVGPAFLKNSSDGIILTDEPDRFQSPLQEWAIIGTVKYIDSKHYRVPRGGAAVELLSGDPCGLRTDLINLSSTSNYTLSFTVGDANDSCVGNFTVYVQVGSRTYNVTMQSSGTGSAFNKTLKFKVDETISSETTTSILFYSVDEMRTGDGLMCGPVLDDIFLFGLDGDIIRNNSSEASYGERKKQVCKGVLVFSFFINAFVMIMELIM